MSSFDRKHEKAWLCRIATNKCLDFIKKTDRQSIPTENDYFAIQSDEEASPEQKVLENEVKMQLKEQCINLKAPYREIAIDYFYHELLPSEIAMKTGKNIKTVQTQIYRARTLLQKSYRKGALNNE